MHLSLFTTFCAPPNIWVFPPNISDKSTPVGSTMRNLLGTRICRVELAPQSSEKYMYCASSNRCIGAILQSYDNKPNHFKFKLPICQFALTILYITEKCFEINVM